MLKQQIEELKKAVIEQANQVDLMIKLSIEGLLEKDNSKLERVLEIEELVNTNEIRIEEEAITLIALQKPEAKNLRTILMIIKMNNDLERMGDLAENITQSAEYLIRKPFIKKLINLPAMAEVTMNMVKQSIDSFINEDTKLAEQVCIDDDIVDDLKEQIYRVLITFMTSDPTTIKRAIHINKIASNLERIADLSTNIAEDTIYIAKGTVVKHQADHDS
ncbi:MAG: phosphate transport system regulatory protein PhoU [Candidatus Cloacimonadota bacterium]|nr:MAG: phosphate transport system regulatory protein PhoU [Candidatus Cloacimonadota bacterium]